MLGSDISTDLARFAIGFDHRDRARLHELWDRILDADRWSEGDADRRVRGGLGPLERPRGGGVQRLDRRRPRRARVGAACAARPCSARRTRSWRRRWQPSTQARTSSSSTATATTSACRSTTSSARCSEHRPRAVFLVHIGGHLAFDVDRIAELCRSEGIVLIEDCAHAHGAEWNGRRAGTWGDAGIWSFAATKTISTGEGGMLVSRASRGDRVRARVPQLRQARLRAARPQLPDERVHGRARDRADRAPRRDRRAGRTKRRARTSTRSTRRGCSCPTG